MPEFRVCPECRGEGFRSKLGAFTQDWLDEQFGGDGLAQDEFVADYMRRGGPYDERCPCCKGERVVTEEQEAAYAEQAMLDAELNAEYEAERRMGA